MRKTKWKWEIRKYSRAFLLLALLLFFSLATDTFWSFDNWSNVANIVLYQAPVLILLSIGMTLVIVLKGIDLSIGAVVAFSSTIAAILMKNTQNVVLGILAGILVGALMGLLNGILIAVVKIPPYIATISVQWILKGVTNIILQGSSLYQFPEGFKRLMQSTAWNYLLVSAAVALAMGILLTRTTYGRNIYAIGINGVAAKISGVRTELVMVSVYMIVGVLGAITGIIYMSFLGGVDANIGADFPIRAISATLVGGTYFGGGKGSVSNAVTGSFVMLVLTNGLLHMGVPAVWQDVVIGLVIILSVAAERNTFLKWKKLKAQSGSI